MGEKKSVYFGEPLLEILRALPEGQTVSGRLNTVAARYLAICREHGVSLSEEERALLRRLLRKRFMDPLAIRHLAAEVEASGYADTEAGRRLVERLRSASYADLVAVVESLGL